MKTDTLDIRHMDCMELMQTLPDGHIDLTVTSPPYGELRSYNGNNSLWSEGVWQRIISELYRITAEGGVVVWICQDQCVNGGESMTSFKQALAFGSSGFKLYDTMIWNKPSPQAPTEGRYYDVFEYMFIFSKGKPKTLNLLKDRKNKSAGSVSNVETRSCREDRKNTGKKRIVPEFSRRFNVWDIGRGKNKSDHPAVFPEQLANDHILSWSNEGDLVFDPFSGSGTTALMASLNKRDFIGSELDGDYYKAACERIKANTQQLSLF
jgi:DNA modification methylase